MNTHLRLVLLFSLLFSLSELIAQPPADYYTATNGKKREALKTALKTIIANPQVPGYDALWDKFKVTDRRADGKVWDIYSNSTNYVFGTNQCGNYGGENVCYNREHSFPKSWFAEAKPMYSDLFHLYPSDGYVNGRRGNYPFGEVENPTYSSYKGYSKLGPCSFPDCTGTVFEPNDEFKGDLARTYFYMATCYENLISNWGGGMTDGSAYPAYKTWAVNLLLKWHRQDPVNDKEINRNNEVYKIQNNRNPYIDYPDLVEFIWGTRQTEAFNPSATASPVIISPLNNMEINLGSILHNTSATKLIALKGTNLTSDINLTISGINASVFSLNRTKWTAAEVMAGAYPEITYTPTEVGQSNAILSIAGEGLASDITVLLSGLGNDGFKATEATELTPKSFVANWTTSATASYYQLVVYNATKSGDPIKIFDNLNSTSQLVDNLTTRTAYRYLVKTFENGVVKQISSFVNVITPTDGKEPVVTINLPEGNILLESTTGSASQMLPIFVTGENLTSPIIVSVPALYEIKTAGSAWSQTLNLQPAGELIYIRISATANPGTYADVLTVINDEAGLSDLDIQAIVDSKYTGNPEVLATWTFPTTNNPNVISAECGIKTGASIYLDGSYGSGKWAPSSIKAYGGVAPASTVCGVSDKTYSLSLLNDGINDKNAVFKLSTKKYGDIKMTYNVQRSSTGFTDHFWLYSTDGNNYTPIDTKISVSTTFTSETLDMSSITILNSQENIYLMLSVKGATANLGNTRLDNIVISGIREIETSLDNSKKDPVQVFAANGELIVKGMTEKGRLQLFDISGRIISENTLWIGETIVSLPQKGIFIVKIASEKINKSFKVCAD